MEDASLLFILVVFVGSVVLSFCFGIGIFFLFERRGEFPTDFLTRGREEAARVEVTTPEAEQTPEALPFLIHPPTPSTAPTSEPTPEPTPEACAGWISYTNDKYRYRFDYDPGWFFNDNPPGSELNDFIILQGDIAPKAKGWPDIEIVGINLQELGSQPQDVDELKEVLEDETSGLGLIDISKVTFGKNNIPAVKCSIAGSPQAHTTDLFYGGEYYYFFHSGESLLLRFNDVASSEAQEIYNCFLQNFETY